MVANGRSNPKNWLGLYADADNGWLALRAAERPAYLASALAEYLDLRGWTPDQLAQWLRCAPQQLVKLALCQRPDSASVEFHQQVSQIVARFQLDYWNLRRLLEELVLEPERRQQIWATQDFLDRAGPRPFASRASGDVMPSFGAEMNEAVPPMQAPRSERPILRQAAFKAPFRKPPAVATPAETPPEPAPARQQSWWERLITAVHNLFSKK